MFYDAMQIRVEFVYFGKQKLVLFSESSQSKDSTVENMKSRFIVREILLSVRNGRS